jgi:zinc D-Ala-D-Ala carboxypeptidase
MKNTFEQIIIGIAGALISAVILKRRGITNEVMSAIFNKQLTPNFNLSELLVTDTGLPNIPNDQEISNLTALAENVLQPVRNLLGVPVRINSAFRSAGVNSAVGGVYNSQHRSGDAADIVPLGMNIDDAFKRIALSVIPFDQLIIETNKRGGRWIHISFNKRGGRRQLLAAVWSDVAGKMVYSPVQVS